MTALLNGFLSLQALCETYSRQNKFNADESGIYYQMAPDKMIERSTITGRKIHKKNLTFMECCNSDCRERFTLMLIGSAANPRCPIVK